MSQHGLAVAGGFHAQTISEWERGLLEPRKESIRGLADALSVDFMWLAFGEGDGPSPAAAADDAGAV